MMVSGFCSPDSGMIRDWPASASESIANGIGAIAKSRNPTSHSALQSAPPQSFELCRWRGRSSFRVCARFCSTPPIAAAKQRPASHANVSQRTLERGACFREALSARAAHRRRSSRRWRHRCQTATAGLSAPPPPAGSSSGRCSCSRRG